MLLLLYLRKETSYSHKELLHNFKRQLFYVKTIRKCFLANPFFVEKEINFDEYDRDDSI
jgi:hypothetical protein